MAVKWVKMIFPDLGVNKKVVDNDENYPNLKFEACTYSTSQENKQKVIFL